MDVRLNSSIILMNFIVKSKEFIIDKYFLPDNLPDNLPDEASPWGKTGSASGVKWTTYSSLWNDSSLCSFSWWRLKQINTDDAQTVSLSSLFQVLITRSLKKCCLKSVLILTRFLFSFNEWPLVQTQGENSKKVSNLTEDKPYNFEDLDKISSDTSVF